MTEMIENKTFDEIQIGDAASLTRVLPPEDVETWAAVTGNVNLIDLDPTPVNSSMFRHGGGQASGRRRCSRRSLTPACPASARSPCSADIHFSSRCRSARGDRHRHSQGEASRRRHRRP